MHFTFYEINHLQLPFFLLRFEIHCLNVFFEGNVCTNFTRQTQQLQKTAMFNTLIPVS